MEHTKGTWEVKKHTNCNYYGAKSSQSDWLLFENALEKDAKRIVACVNACAGFSEAELENLGNLKAMHETIVAERNALLNEVERLRKLIQPTSSGTREGDGC